MALRDRIFSLETEYAISFFSDDGSSPSAGAIVDVLTRALATTHAARKGGYLVNGSLLAHDVGHAEWSLPECRTAREVACYDKAADHLFHIVVPHAGELLAGKGYHGRLVVTKNNDDGHGHTYGCHENYQMQRDSDLLEGDAFVRYAAQAMIPFLVSRQLLTGSGRLLSSTRAWRGHLPYELSQRSAFIATVVSRDTTKERPIFNLGREGESFAAGNFRRFHPVLGDANLSGWATWIKLASTGLILRLVEDLYIQQPPLLRAPVDAVRAINGDLTGTQTVPLQDGRQMTALDLQWWYYDQVDGYLNLTGASADDEDVMEAWGAALEDLEQDPQRLRDRADWAIKKYMLETYLGRQGYDPQQLPGDRALQTDLLAYDLRYHEISPDGLYARAYPVDTLLGWADIEQAQECPPPHTRAHLRGGAVRLSRACDLTTRPGGWMGFSLHEYQYRLDDPLAFDHPQFMQWDRPWETLAAEVDAHPDSAARHYRLGLCYQTIGWYQRALQSLTRATELESDTDRYSAALAETALVLGRYDEALEWAQRAAPRLRRRGHASNLSALLSGDVFRLRGDPDAALAQYELVQSPPPHHLVQAQIGTGLAHMQHGDWGAARTALERAVIAGQPTALVLGQVALGVLLHAAGEQERARLCFEAAQRTPPIRQRRDEHFRLPYKRALLTIAGIGLERPGALDDLRAALAALRVPFGRQTYTLLLRRLAQSDPAPAQAAEALALVEADPVPPDPPDPDEPQIHADYRTHLAAALSSTSDQVRQQALEYAAWRFAEHDTAAINALLPAVLALAQDTRQPDVQRAAVTALGYPALADTDARSVLLECAQAGHAGVRWTAEDALDRLHRPPVVRTESPRPPGSDASAHRDAPDDDASTADPARWLAQLARRQETASRRRAIGVADDDDDDDLIPL